MHRPGQMLFPPDVYGTVDSEYYFLYCRGEESASIMWSFSIPIRILL